MPPSLTPFDMAGGCLRRMDSHPLLPVVKPLSLGMAEFEAALFASFTFAMLDSGQEWRTYAYIAKTLDTFAVGMSSLLQVVSVIPQPHLVRNVAIPDFCVYLHQLSDEKPSTYKSTSLVFSWEAKSLSSAAQAKRTLQDYKTVAEFWSAMGDVARTSLDKHYPSLESYAEKYFENDPAAKCLYKFFSVGPVFLLLAFKRNRCFKNFTLEQQYTKGINVEELQSTTRLAPIFYYFLQPMFVISEDRTRICPSQQLLSALHLPFQALDSMTSTISKVSWLSGLHPDEDNVYTRKGMAVGMQHIHGLVAREFVSNFINYFESCKRKLPSSESEAQVSEYVVTPEKRMNYHSTVDIASPIRTRTRAARKARSVPQQSQSAILPVPPRRKEIRTTTPPPRRPFLQAKQTASQGPVQARTVQDINPPPQGGTSNVQPVDGVHRHARRSESIAHGGGSHVRFAVQDQRATEAPPRHTTRYKRSHTTDSSDDGTLLKVAKDSRANDVWSAASRPRLPHGTARNVDLAEPSTHCDSVSSLAGTAHDVPPTGAVASTASQAHSYQGPSDSYMKRTTQTVVQREVAHTVTTTPHRGTPSSSTNSGHDVLSISGDVASTASAASKRKLDDAASSTRTGPEPDLPIQASAPATTEGDELRTPAGEADEVSLSAPKRAGQSAQSSSTATEPRERVEPGANGVIWVIIDPGLLDPLRTDDLKVTDNVEVVSEDDSEPGPVRRKSLATGTGTAKVSPGKGKGRPRVKRQFRLQAVVYIPPHHFHNGGAGPVRRRGANHGGTDALQTEVPTSDGQSQQGNESNEDGDGEDESGNWEDEDEESE